MLCLKSKQFIFPACLVGKAKVLFVQMAFMNIRFLPNMLEFYVRYFAMVSQFQRTNLGYQDWLAMSKMAYFVENLGKYLQEGVNRKLRFQKQD